MRSESSILGVLFRFEKRKAMNLADFLAKAIKATARIMTTIKSAICA